MVFLSLQLDLDSDEREGEGHWKLASSKQCLQEGRAHSEFSGVLYKIFVLLFHAFQPLLCQEFLKVLYCERGLYFFRSRGKSPFLPSWLYQRSKLVNPHFAFPWWRCGTVFGIRTRVRLNFQAPRMSME